MAHDETTGTWTDSCTLSAAERPARRAEFDELFAGALRGQRRLEGTWLRWELDPAAEARARDLAARESDCCSFFAFAFTSEPGRLSMDVRVPPGRTDTLDALEALAAGALPAS